MKKFKDIALIVFVLCLTTLIFSCGNKTTEPEIPDIGELVLVPGGTFIMGDTRDQGHSNEFPTHSVTLSSYYIGKYQVTQDEYKAIMGSNPSVDWGVENNYPVYNVSWYDAIKYCNLRSMNEGLMPVYKVYGSVNPADWGEVPDSGDSIWNAAFCDWDANGYRLPTEAEWEYAARGGASDPDYLYSGSDNIDEVAWHNGNTYECARPVGGKAANGLGLYDMSGNVYEWCWDWYDGGYYSISPSDNPTGYLSGTGRLLRGGSWSYHDDDCRVSHRNGGYPTTKDSNIGFRICRNAND